MFTQIRKFFELFWNFGKYLISDLAKNPWSFLIFLGLSIGLSFWVGLRDGYLFFGSLASIFVLWCLSELAEKFPKFWETLKAKRTYIATKKSFGMVLRDVSRLYDREEFDSDLDTEEMIALGAEELRKED